jgi:hypothetical protein
MSLSASGTLGKTLTASIWKGQPYMRLRVVPINRNTAGQKTVRSVLGTLAKACRAVLTSFQDTEDPAVGSQFFQDAVSVAPAGQSWISYLQKVSNSEFAANVILFAALSPTNKGYWNTTATALGMSAYIDKSGVTHTNGEQLYLLGKFATSYLGYSAWATTQDAAVQIEVTAFGAYVQTSTSA